MSKRSDSHGHTESRQPMSPFPIESKNSGTYDPGPIGNEDGQSAELSDVEAWRDDLQLEEFPEGPYGSSTNGPAGKSQAWHKGQASVSAHRDQNPVDSNRKRAAHEPPFTEPPGTQEGQN